MSLTGILAFKSQEEIDIAPWQHRRGMAVGVSVAQLGCIWSAYGEAASSRCALVDFPLHSFTTQSTMILQAQMGTADQKKMI